MKKGSSVQTLKFEEALKELESVVEKLEAGDVALEKSLELYEKGIGFYRFCSGKLEEAKKKVEILTQKSGKMVAEPFRVETSHDEGEEEKEELPF